MYPSYLGGRVLGRPAGALLASVDPHCALLLLALLLRFPPAPGVQVFSGPVFSYRVSLCSVHCTVFSCTVFSCTVVSCTVFSCTVLSCIVFSCTVFCCTVFSVQLYSNQLYGLQMYSVVCSVHLSGNLSQLSQVCRFSQTSLAPGSWTGSSPPAGGGGGGGAMFISPP